MTYLPPEVVLIFLFITVGFVLGGIGTWQLINRSEARTREEYEKKIELEIDKLRIEHKEEAKEDRHRFREELQLLVFSLERSLKEADTRQREMKTWIDRQEAKNG